MGEGEDVEEVGGGDVVVFEVEEADCSTGGVEGTGGSETGFNARGEIKERRYVDYRQGGHRRGGVGQ